MLKPGVVDHPQIGEPAEALLEILQQRQETQRIAQRLIGVVFIDEIQGGTALGKEKRNASPGVRYESRRLIINVGLDGLLVDVVVDHGHEDERRQGHRRRAENGQLPHPAKIEQMFVRTGCDVFMIPESGFE